MEWGFWERNKVLLQNSQNPGTKHSGVFVFRKQEMKIDRITNNVIRQREYARQQFLDAEQRKKLIMEKVERAKQMLEAQRAKSHRLYAWLVLKSGNEDHAVHYNKQ